MDDKILEDLEKWAGGLAWDGKMLRDLLCRAIAEIKRLRQELEKSA